MRTFWAFVKIETGSFMRVTIQANTFYDAQQMLLAQYGSRLMSVPSPC